MILINKQATVIIASYLTIPQSRLQSFKNGLTQRLIYLQREAFTPATGDQPNANNVGIVFVDRRGDIDQSVSTLAKSILHIYACVCVSECVYIYIHIYTYYIHIHAYTYFLYHNDTGILCMAA